MALEDRDLAGTITDATPEEIEQWRQWEAKAQQVIAFEREEVRRSKKQRTLDCHHRIDPTEPYRYRVWKVIGTFGVEQERVCDVCMRRDHRY